MEVSKVPASRRPGCPREVVGEGIRSPIFFFRLQVATSLSATHGTVGLLDVLASSRHGDSPCAVLVGGITNVNAPRFASAAQSIPSTAGCGT